MLISVVNNSRNEIDGNSHAEIEPPWYFDILRNLTNWLNTLRRGEII